MTAMTWGEGRKGRGKRAGDNDNNESATAAFVNLASSMLLLFVTV